MTRKTFKPTFKPTKPEPKPETWAEINARQPNPDPRTEEDWADINRRLEAGEAVSCYPGEPPTTLFIDANGKKTYCRGMSKAEIAHHQRRTPVTGSAFKDDPDPRIKREPEQPEPLTREEMEQLNQARVDALRAQGRLPSFDKVREDVIDWLERMGYEMPEEAGWDSIQWKKL